jgi:hypothetical protein
MQAGPCLLVFHKAAAAVSANEIVLPAGCGIVPARSARQRRGDECASSHKSQVISGYGNQAVARDCSPPRLSEPHVSRGGFHKPRRLGRADAATRGRRRVYWGLRL